ncbi:RAD55 family ATPase [Pyrococcus furiosus]|uniref:RAD55 family ATPase n=1 Tax=Pyrococcus furiosus TaxID=2261 RepID=UPI000A621024
MSTVAERIPTGVKGLDELIEGGLIPGRVYLITGPPGSGKTTLACNFFWKGLEEEKKEHTFHSFISPKKLLKI